MKIDGSGIMILGLMLNALFAVLSILNEDFVLGVGLGMFVVVVGAIKFGRDEGLI